MLFLSVALALAADPVRDDAVTDVLAAMARPEPDPARLSAYTAACAGGDASACSDAGVVHERAGNKAEAVAAHVKACDGGWWFSCNNLILLGDPRGQARMAERHRAPCAGGSGYACDQLSLYTTDEAERERATARACELGAALSCYQVGLKLHATDPDGALAAYRRACELGSPDGCMDQKAMERERKGPR